MIIARRIDCTTHVPPRRLNNEEYNLVLRLAKESAIRLYNRHTSEELLNSKTALGGTYRDYNLLVEVIEVFGITNELPEYEVVREHYVSTYTEWISLTRRKYATRPPYHLIYHEQCLVLDLCVAEMCAPIRAGVAAEILRNDAHFYSVVSLFTDIYYTGVVSCHEIHNPYYVRARQVLEPDFKSEFK